METHNAMQARGTEMMQTIRYDHSPIGVVSCPPLVYLEALKNTLPSLRGTGIGSNYFIRLNYSQWNRYRFYLISLFYFSDLPVELIRLFWWHFLLIANELTVREYYHGMARLTGGKGEALL
jgi:hypothetical protein